MKLYKIRGYTYDIEVGWDPELETFYAGVYLEEGGINYYLTSWGRKRKEISSTIHLDTVLDPYGEIPSDIIQKLRRDSSKY